jgi:DNA repair protein SbcC/Rad50
MKFSRIFFKPRWQSKDAATRRGAVAELSDAELIAALPTIARNDADAGVRLAALRRLNQYEAWRERSTGDQDSSLREAARNAYLAMLTGGSRDLPPLERRIAELDTLSGEEIERVVAQATDPALRSAALERATRPSLLAEVAASDGDPKLRLVALSRITDVDALARVAERTRKTDKIVSRLARDRAEAGRIAAGDATTIEARARQLCERIDALLSRPRSERSEELAALDTAWEPLAGKAPPQLAERFASTRRFLRADTEEAAAERGRLRELRTRLEQGLAAADSPTAELEALAAGTSQALAASRVELPERENVENLLVRLTQRLAQRAVQAEQVASAAAAAQAEAEAEPAPAPDTLSEANLEALAAQARFDAALERAQADKEKQREQHQALKRDLDQLVIELEQQLEAGDLAHASATQARIATLLEGLPPVARHDKRLANAEARFAELKRWQRWSNNERRKQLCEALEALPALGLHPDAVATRVREARDEWQKLDAIEADKDARGAQGLGRRFQALCTQALKPTKGYFDKRDELRKSNQQEIETLLQGVESEAAESTDLAALAKRRREAADALRTLDGIDPRARKTLAQRLKDVLARIDTRLDEHAAGIEAAKRRLIAEAERLAAAPDAAAASREVRDLQARWKAAGNGRRRTDEAQWKEFRAHCDAVFARLDGARREREEADNAARTEAQALLSELQQLAAAPAAQQPAQRRELEQRWAALGLRDRELEQRWQQQREALDAVQREAQKQKRDALFHDALARLALIEARELGNADANTVAGQWQQLGEPTGPLAAALHSRYGAGLQREGADGAGANGDAANDNAGNSGSDNDGNGNENARRDLLVTLEFLGAVDTPEADKARRMDLQVSRLSQRMSGTGKTAPREELQSLLQRWISLGALPSAEWQVRFQRAFAAALAQAG